MPSAGHVLALSLPALSAGCWIDVACVAVLVVFIAWDAARGFSTTLSVLLGLLIAIHAGYWLYPPLEAALGKTAFCAGRPAVGALLPYAAAVGAGVVLFLVFRYFFRRFFKLIVEQPMDRALGAIAGAAKALLLMLIVFSGASLLPEGSGVRRAFCQESRAGRSVVPVVQALLARGRDIVPRRRGR